MNRKATFVAYESVIWMVRLMFLVIVIFSIVVIFSTKTEIEINVDAPHRFVVLQSLLYSPDGLAYEKEDKIGLAGIVLDREKFRQEELTEFIEGGVKASACFSLNAPCFEQIGTETDSVVFYNKEMFEQLYPLAEAELFRGRGGVSLLNSSKTVRVYDAGTIQTEVLYYEILLPNN